MVSQVGGSTPFAPEGDEESVAGHRHPRCSPRLIQADQVTVAIGTSEDDITSMMRMDDVAGTHMVGPTSDLQIPDGRPAGPESHRTRSARVNMGSRPTPATRSDRASPRASWATRSGTVCTLADERLFQHGRRRRRRKQPVRLGGAHPSHSAGVGLHVPDEMRLSYPLAAVCIGTRPAHPRPGSRKTCGTARQESVSPRWNKSASTPGSDEPGRPLATPEETREILKLGVMYDSPDETLFKLGLPPLRGEGERGFPVYDAEGRFLKQPQDTGVDPTDILVVPARTAVRHR